MTKIPLILSLAILSGCASQHELNQVDAKVNAMNIKLNEVFEKTNTLSEKQSVDNAETKRQIEVLKSDYNHINDDVSITKDVILDIKKSLTNINGKTDAISRKLFPEKAKKAKKPKK